MTRQPAGKWETIMVVAKEKATTMATEYAVQPPSRDLMTTALVLATEVLAALTAVTAAAMVLTAEAAALVLTAEAVAALQGGCHQ